MTVIEIPLVDLAQFQASGGVTVGGATAVAADDGDASYLEVASGTTVDIGGTPYLDTTSDAWSGYFAPTDLPASARVDGATIRVTYRVSEWNNTSYSSLMFFLASDPAALATTAGRQPGTVCATDVADPTRANWVNLSQSATAWATTSNSYPGALDAGALRGGTVPLWLYERGMATPPANRVRITEIVLVIAYTAPTVAPPLRQFPRTDGLATSSARRMWPPSRSIQRSLRQGPGAYL